MNQVFADESFDADVSAYVSEFEKMSASAMALTKTLLYQMDGLAFPEALETGADVNVIARLTDDCQEKVAEVPTEKLATDFKLINSRIAIYEPCSRRRLISLCSAAEFLSCGFFLHVRLELGCGAFRISFELVK